MNIQINFTVSLNPLDIDIFGFLKVFFQIFPVMHKSKNPFSKGFLLSIICELGIFFISEGMGSVYNNNKLRLKSNFFLNEQTNECLYHHNHMYTKQNMI